MEDPNVEHTVLVISSVIGLSPRNKRATYWLLLPSRTAERRVSKNATPQRMGN